MKSNRLESASFYSHHSPWGGYFSFIIGKIGYGGGVVINDVKPPANNIYIGYKKRNNRPRLFPFFSEIPCSINDEVFQSNKGNETVQWCKKNADIFEETEIERIMNWTTESWHAEAVTMTIITPFSDVPDIKKLDNAAARFVCCPAIFIQLEFDNRNAADEMTGIFAFRDIQRIISQNNCYALQGFANRGLYGVAAKKDVNTEENLGWNIIENIFGIDVDPAKVTGSNRIFGMGNEGGLSFKIFPGEKKQIVLALGSYIDGVVTTGIKAKYYYTQLFSDLEEVLDYALSNFEKYYQLALKKDNELESANLNEYRKFIIAHAARSYMANTQLLVNQQNEPLFVVYEGEYQLMNTLDLSVDQVFWEMNFTPWTIQNQLESYLEHYSYKDSVRYNNGREIECDLCFCHDQGIANIFSAKGFSAYELSGLTGCFSYMTYEENLNWLLTAAVYGLRGKNSEWLINHAAVFSRLFNTLIVWDEDNDGIMDKDSGRCKGGSEITTYDSLDASLGQAKMNLYLAVKTWAGYVCLENIFKLLNNTQLMHKTREMSVLCASGITAHYDRENGYIPAVFEKNNRSKIIPAIEGLLYPYIIGDTDAVSCDGRFGDFIKILKQHLENVLVPGICINPVSKGWQLSSTAENSWMSKIFINQFIAEKILKIQNSHWKEWDKIHSSWQQVGCSFATATDQINCTTGTLIGSRVYPRLVTSLLWMKY